MAKKDKDVKEKKQNSNYFKEMKTELKKVVWPTPKELVNNTLAVIIFVLCIAVIVFVSDLCFDNLNKYGITKLQEHVKSSFQTTEDSGNDTSEEEKAEEDSSENTNTEVVVDGEENQETTEETENQSEQSNEEDASTTESNESN